jgi:hypothetical protein
MRGRRRGGVKIKRLAHPEARVAHPDRAGATLLAPRRVHDALPGKRRLSAERLATRRAAGGGSAEGLAGAARGGGAGAEGLTVPREHSAHTTRPHARQWWRPEKRFQVPNCVPQPEMAHSDASLSGCQYFLAICRAGRAGDVLHAGSRLSCARGVAAPAAVCSGALCWASAASWTIASAVLTCSRPAILPRRTAACSTAQRTPSGLRAAGAVRTVPTALLPLDASLSRPVPRRFTPQQFPPRALETRISVLSCTYLRNSYSVPRNVIQHSSICTGGCAMRYPTYKQDRPRARPNFRPKGKFTSTFAKQFMFNIATSGFVLFGTIETSSLYQNQGTTDPCARRNVPAGYLKRGKKENRSFR